MVEWNIGVMRHEFIIICKKVNGSTVEAQCSGSTSPSHKKFICRQGMVCVFWERQEVVFVNLMSWGHNVNAVYRTLMSDQLLTTSNLLRGLLSRHDNDFHPTPHLSDSSENWRDELGIVTTSAIQSRPLWFLFVWTTHGIVWRHCLRTMKMFNNMFGSFYIMPSKNSVLQTSAD